MDSEAYATVGKDVILNNLAVLGIRRAVKLSDEQREARARRLPRTKAERAA
jgi:hypothetical protein